MRHDRVWHSAAGALQPSKAEFVLKSAHLHEPDRWSVLATPQVTDNSGAKTAQCINQSGRSWGIGDIITVAVKSAAVRGAPFLTLFLYATYGWYVVVCGVSAHIADAYS